MSVDLEALRRAAEAEMLREAPDGPGGPPAKRQRRHADSGEVMTIGRYDYAAARSVQGPAFLVSCNFRREKSAVKEAVAALQHFLPRAGSSAAVTGSATAHAVPTDVQPENGASPQGDVQASSEACVSPATPDAAADQPTAAAADAPGTAAQTDRVVAAASPAIASDPPPTDAQPCASAIPQHAEAAGKAAAVVAAAAVSASAAATNGGGVGLSVVKLGCSGLMLLQAQGLAPGAATTAVAALLADMASGALRRFQHCHRIVPVETICELSEAALGSGVRCAVSAFLGGAATAQLSHPSSYAVAYKQRGSAGGETQSVATASARAPKVTAAAAPQPFAAAADVSSAAAAAIAAEASPPRAPAEPDSTPAVRPFEAAYGGGCANSGHPGSMPAQELSRRAAIQIMASATAGAAAAAGFKTRVDLKAPDWALVAEALPVAGSSGLLVGLAAVPAAMLTLKPKLVVTATTAQTK